MIYGYRRVSTKSQAKDGNSLEAQEAALKAAGAQKIYSDAFTGTKTDGSYKGYIHNRKSDRPRRQLCMPDYNCNKCVCRKIFNSY